MSYTPNEWVWLPPYGGYGVAEYGKFNAAMTLVDAELELLSIGYPVLANLINNWAIEDQIVTMIPVTCTYFDNNTFTLTGDYTSRFPIGAVVHIHVAAGMVYSTVASSSYTAPTTTVNLDDTVLTDPITRVYVVATRDGLWPNGPGYVVARDYGTDRVALEAADAVAAVAGKELRITYPFAIDDDVILAAPKVSIMPGAVLAISTTKTLTINSPLDAGPYQIFSCTGTGKAVFGVGTIKETYGEWWGGAADGATENAPAWQAALTSGCPTMQLLAGTYMVSATVYPILVTADTLYRFTVKGAAGGKTIIKPTGMADGTYVFRVNEDSGGTVIYQSATQPQIIVENVAVDGVDSTGAGFIHCSFSGPMLTNVRFDRMLYGVVANLYTDMVRLDNVRWNNAISGGWLYRNTFAGDAFFANNIHTAEYDVVWLKNCQGGVIQACLNGHWRIENSGGLVYQGNHNEYQQTGHTLWVRNSDIKITGNSFRNDGGSGTWYYPVYVDDNPAVERPSNIVIEDNIFNRNVNNALGRLGEIRINALNENTQIELRHNIARPFRVDVTDWDPYLYNDVGIQIRSAIAALDTTLSAWRGILSGHCLIRYDRTATAGWRLFSPPGAREIAFPSLLKPSLTVTEVSDPYAYTGTMPAATYYYRIVAQNDGNLARTEKSDEVSQAKAGGDGAGGSSLRLVIAADPGTILYVYRGTAADTYNTLFRIPLCKSLTVLHDMGSFVSTYPAEAGSYTPATTNISFKGYYDVRTGNRRVWGPIASRPSTGTRAWIHGDQWTATDPASAAAAMEWCTVAGSPGTWLGSALP